MNREMKVVSAVNRAGQYVSCSVCNWKQGFEPKDPRYADEALRTLFESHDCEDYPLCDAPGCKNAAFAGFQPFIDAGSFDNPTAKILGNREWWCASHSSMADKFAREEGDWLRAKGVLGHVE